MHLWESKKPIIPLHYPIYFWTVIIITLIGIFDSIYLAISHYRNYADIGYHSFCAISTAINCDTVSQSAYSIFLNVPVPIWGIIAFVFFFVLLIFASPLAHDRKRIWASLMVIALGFCFYCVILATISSFLIHSYCLMCILGYAVCFLLLYFSWLIRNRFSNEKLFTAVRLDIIYLMKFPKIVISILSLFSVIILIVFLFLPQYWHLTPPKLTTDLPRGITEDGHSWIGAEDPELLITEFADYLCFSCKKNHFYLRQIIQDNPDKIRLIHRHFPMDHSINPLVKEPFHEGGAKLALMAIYAAENGKFWEVNDLLFDVARKNNEITIRYVAEKTGLEVSKMRFIGKNNILLKKLLKDINEGLHYGITGTPTYIINDHLYVGHVPPDILEKYFK